MRKVSLVFIVLGLVALFLNVSLAKEPPMDKKGKWGISLSVSGLSNLGIGLYQGGIGIKHWRSDNVAWKARVGYGLTDTFYPAQFQGMTDAKIKQANFSVNLGPEFHFAQESKFSPYFYTGAGISVAVNTYYYSVNISDLTPGTVTKKRTTTTSLGLDGAIGLEYLFSKRLSLAAEYQVSLSYQFYREKWTVSPGTGPTYPITHDSDTFNIGAKTSSLILTVYF